MPEAWSARLATPAKILPLCRPRFRQWKPALHHTSKKQQGMPKRRSPYSSKHSKAKPAKNREATNTNSERCRPKREETDNRRDQGTEAFRVLVATQKKAVKLPLELFKTFEKSARTTEKL